MKKLEVLQGQRWLITAGAALWKQREDFVLTVEETYELSAYELKQYDVITADAMRGVTYAVLSNDEVAGIQLDVDTLIDIGTLVP